MTESSSVMVYIDTDERYPDHWYTIVDVNSAEWERKHARSVTRETLDRWTRIEAEYDAMQKEMSELQKHD